MNKKFLKSVAIAGLASTILGMEQTVGAVVNNKKYHSQFKKVEKEFQELKGTKIHTGHVKDITNNLLDLIAIVHYILAKTSFEMRHMIMPELN
ncbi:hypothetical protein ACVRW4_08470 [Streptococcus phocae subsp. phocae]